jgi:type I restriction enzyme S subunit
MENEWRKSELGEVAAVRSGYAFKSNEWTDTGIPVVKIANVKNGRLEMSGCSFVPESIAAEAGEFQLATGDILIAMTGYIGEVARVRTSDLPCVLNQRVGKFSVKNPKLLDADFLYAFLSFSETRKAIEALGYGTAQPNVSSSLIHKVLIPLPPLSEQKRIAGILGTLDEKIELNRKINETLEQMAKALFKSWFVDFDPVHAKAAGRQPAGMDRATADLFPDSFVDSELGKTPKGWTAGSVYEISEVKYGAPFASNLFNSTGTGKPLVRIRDLADESPAVFTTEVHPKGYLLQPGDIAVGMDGEFRAYLWAGIESWLNQRVCVFAPKEGFSAAFVRNSIMAPLSEVESTETATTVIHLGKNDIDRFKVIIPNREIANSFSRLCQPWYDKIVLNKQESRTLSTIRETLLPKLLNGEA